MQISCNSCGGQFKLAAHQEPTDKPLRFKCPQCQQPIQVDPPEVANEKPIDNAIGGKKAGADAESFAFMAQGRKTALICMKQTDMAEKAEKALERLDYFCAAVKTSINALKRMRFHNFDLVMVEETLDGQGPSEHPLLNHLARLEMGLRRRMFVVLVSEELRTMDYMAAFSHSVNMTLNTENVKECDKMLKLALDEHEHFYRVYQEIKA